MSFLRERSAGAGAPARGDPIGSQAHRRPFLGGAHPGSERAAPAPSEVIGSDRPLCFLHIPKTGGTSLTDALSRIFPPEDVFTGDGNLTVGYLASLEGRLTAPGLIAGHAGHGTAALLQGRADLITLLRRPADQAVSNYLHVLSDADHPLHQDASSQSFADYLRAHDDQIDFQATSLMVPLTAGPAEAIARRREVEPLLRFLDSFGFVGVMESMDRAGTVLGRLLPEGAGVAVACLNSAVYRGVSVRTLDRLKAEYRSLEGDAALAPLFAREARVHAAAVAHLERLERALVGARTKRPPFAGFLSSRRFSTPHGRPAGSASIARLTEPPSHLAYGPYDMLPRGRWSVEFQFSLQDASPLRGGRIELDVTANGRTCLVRSELNTVACLSGERRTLTFFNDEEANVLEFRLLAAGFSQGVLLFEGVTLRQLDRRPGLLAGLGRRGVSGGKAD